MCSKNHIMIINYIPICNIQWKFKHIFITCKVRKIKVEA